MDGGGGSCRGVKEQVKEHTHLCLLPFRRIQFGKRGLQGRTERRCNHTKGCGGGGDEEVGGRGQDGG